MLKVLILISLCVNIAFAKDRFSEADKKRFLDDVKQEIAEHKLENKGRLDLQIIKPGLYAELEEYLKQEKFTREEMLTIKQHYENFSKNKNMPAQEIEEAFYNFLRKELEEINKKPLEKVREGNICNNWSCADGLKCAPDPIQQASGKLKKSGAACLESSECVSNECVEETAGSKKKVCEDVYRCFRPLNLGESCAQNPVCSAGSCLAFNSLTSGIGECSNKGNSCKKNSDCCSNSCNGGVCKDNFICKDCVSNGSKPQRGQKCCEGLYLNEKGMCAPDVPPSVIPQVRVTPIKSFFMALNNLFISEAAAQDEAADAVFLQKGAVNDGLDLKSGVKAFEAKNPDLKVTPARSQALNMNEKKPDLKFAKRSNFATCDITFKDDFYNALKKDGAMDLEVAMLGFDFVITGDGENDYWTESKSPDTSIYGRLKKVGLAHRKVRQDTNNKIDAINKKLTCMCLDVQGLDKISSVDKQKFFKESCDEYGKYLDPTTSYDELNGDASGVKAKRLLVAWTQNLQQFHASLTVDNNEAYTQLLAISNWADSPQARWGEAREDKIELFKFNIKNPSNSVAGLGAIVGALLAAGVIAILGGFSTTSILSSWAAAGIITATAATGAGGLWMVASLKGAWITKKPEISDGLVSPRSYSCGKKETCMEYTRMLVQPYNEVCNIHTSSNACLKSFVVINEDSQSRYIVDPWIPAEVGEEKVLKFALLKKQPLYTEMMEQGYKAALAGMRNKNPGATGGGGKKGGGEFVSESYLSEVFIDADILGKYVPHLEKNLENTYFMSADKVKLIKEAAKKFAIHERFLEEGDTENLEAFANYAYEYHFLWPKKSRPEEISYPTVGLTTYLSFMAKDVSGSLTTGLANTAKDLSTLNQKYVEDYLKTLILFKDAPINQSDALKTTLLAKDIEKVQKDLNSLITLNALLDNQALDSQLSKLSSTFVAEQSKLAGINGTANFSTGQSNFLKAVGNLRSTRKTQLQARNTYAKAMADSGNKERTAKMAEVSKKFSSKFAKGSAAFGNGFGSVAGAGGADGSSTDNKDADKNAGKNNSNVYGNVYDLNSGSDGSSGGRSGSNGSGSSGSGSSANSMNSGNSSGLSASEADQKRLADAIEARNKMNKDKYNTKDEQTLFEQVTNAYIRNYDKVLSKKKDKDVIEDKQ